MCWWLADRGGGPQGVLEASHIAVSFWMFEQVGGCGIVAVVGSMRRRVRSQSADGKCQALPSMVFRLRVDGCCSVMEV